MLCGILDTWVDWTGYGDDHSPAWSSSRPIVSWSLEELAVGLRWPCGSFYPLLKVPVAACSGAGGVMPLVLVVSRFWVVILKSNNVDGDSSVYGGRILGWLVDPWAASSLRSGCIVAWRNVACAGEDGMTGFGLPCTVAVVVPCTVVLLS